MTDFKVVFFGAKSSGKSQLIKRMLLGQEHQFQENSPPTVGVDFLTKTHINYHDKVRLSDLTGDARFAGIIDSYYKDATLGVFCVDLTQPINEQQISGQISIFREKNPDSPIILVGTKSDSPLAQSEALNKISAPFSAVMVTSAKEDIGVEALFECISDLCTEQKVITPWKNAVKKLVEHLSHLPLEKMGPITQELHKLKKALFAQEAKQPSLSPEEQAQVINNFTTNCQVILEGKYPNVWNTVLTVAAVAAVTTIAAFVGFGIGFALGLWTGPGAFITGLVAGTTAAVTVATSSAVVGGITGGIIAYGLFKTSKEMSAVNVFTSEVNTWLEDIKI